MSICSDRIHPKVKVDVVALRRVHVPEMRIARKVKLEAWFDDLGQNCRKNTIELHEKIVCDQVPSIIECLRAIGNTVDFENADVGAVAEADVVASDCQSHYIGFLIDGRDLVVDDGFRICTGTCRPFTTTSQLSVIILSEHTLSDEISLRVSELWRINDNIHDVGICLNIAGACPVTVVEVCSISGPNAESIGVSQASPFLDSTRSQGGEQGDDKEDITARGSDLKGALRC